MDIESFAHWHRLGMMIFEEGERIEPTRTYFQWLLEYPQGSLLS